MLILSRTNMSFKKILVAYDGSGFSNRAFKSALDIAERDNSIITIATVVTGIFQPSIGFSMKFNKDLLKKQNKAMEKIFSNLKKTANKKGIGLSLKILRNPSVSKGILKYLNFHRFDLVVVGSRGRTGLNKFILGSVANEIVNKTNVPVMVVK